MIKVGVVAESAPMRVGLREVLNNMPDLVVESAVSCLEDLPTNALDVLVVVSPANLGKPRNNQPVLYLINDPAELRELKNLDYFACGVLPSNASENELNIAIHALAEGLWVGAPGLMRQLLSEKQIPALDEFDLATQALTGREVEVLQLAAQGLANKQIARQLAISEHTIKFHLSSIYTKMGVASRTEAVRVGVRRGLVVL